MVDVLTIENNVPLTAHQLKFLTENLPVSMVEKANKFRRWQDSQAYLLSKFLLVEGLRKYGLTRAILNEIKYTQFGRPYLSLDIDFNISHSGKNIVCAITKYFKVGIDIEEIQRIDIDDFAGQFTEKELASIHGAVDKYAEFFKYWTMKEAVIKADGRGLSMPIKQILMDLRTDAPGGVWHIYEIDIQAGYMSHLVINTVLKEPVNICRMSLPF
jgi:4'-phosphopantetheinyl transferase